LGRDEGGGGVSSGLNSPNKRRKSRDCLITNEKERIGEKTSGTFALHQYRRGAQKGDSLRKGTHPSEETDKQAYMGTCLHSFLWKSHMASEEKRGSGGTTFVVGVLSSIGRGNV